jgi:tetratricopeptide (TPR) repeat protein
MVRHVENYQSKGLRNVWEYVLFDPVILYRPQWPRGIALTGDFSEHQQHSVLRESVPTGVYANAWFDGGTGIIVPPVTNSEQSRRAGQVLLTLALAPSILIVIGVVLAVRRLWRDGWDDTLVAMLLTSGTMAALFVQATTTVPMHAAVKSTYLTPVSLTFAFWFALGADALRRADTRWFRRIAVVCVLLFGACVTVFTHNLAIARNWLALTASNAAAWQNVYGIVYYAAGDRARALDLFRSAAQENWYLAEENLGYLLRQDGRPLEALYHVRNAAQWQLRQSFGTPQDRARFDRMNQADYQNQLAVIYYQMGWVDLALAAADKAYELDPSVPEIAYDLAVMKVTHALARPRSDAQRALAIAQSRQLLFGATMQDPAFVEVWALAGALDALDGNCERAVTAIQKALAPPPNQYRLYPTSTGPGNVHAAGLGRRKTITDLPEQLRPEYQLARCTARTARR